MPDATPYRGHRFVGALVIPQDVLLEDRAVEWLGGLVRDYTIESAAWFTLLGQQHDPTNPAIRSSLDSLVIRSPYPLASFGPGRIDWTVPSKVGESLRLLGYDTRDPKTCYMTGIAGLPDMGPLPGSSQPLAKTYAYMAWGGNVSSSIGWSTFTESPGRTFWSWRHEFGHSVGLSDLRHGINHPVDLAAKSIMGMASYWDWLLDYEWDAYREWALLP